MAGLPRWSTLAVVSLLSVSMYPLVRHNQADKMAVGRVSRCKIAFFRSHTILNGLFCAMVMNTLVVLGRAKKPQYAHGSLVSLRLIC